MWNRATCTCRDTVEGRLVFRQLQVRLAHSRNDLRRQVCILSLKLHCMLLSLPFDILQCSLGLLLGLHINRSMHACDVLKVASRSGQQTLIRAEICCC